MHREQICVFFSIEFIELNHAFTQQVSSSPFFCGAPHRLKQCKFSLCLCLNDQGCPQALRCPFQSHKTPSQTGVADCLNNKAQPFVVSFCNIHKAHVFSFCELFFFGTENRTLQFQCLDFKLKITGKSLFMKNKKAGISKVYFKYCL